MGKPPGQSELHFVSPNIDHHLDMAKNGANPRVAKAIYVVVIVLVVALVILVGIGLHVPRGE